MLYYIALCYYTISYCIYHIYNEYILVLAATIQLDILWQGYTHT